jgi:hypothetical protein
VRIVIDQNAVRKAAAAVRHNEARLRLGVIADDPLEISRALIRFGAANLERAEALDDVALVALWDTYLAAFRDAHRTLFPGRVPEREG